MDGAYLATLPAIQAKRARDLHPVRRSGVRGLGADCPAGHDRRVAWMEGPQLIEFTGNTPLGDSVAYITLSATSLTAVLRFPDPSNGGRAVAFGAQTWEPGGSGSPFVSSAQALG